MVVPYKIWCSCPKCGHIADNLDDMEQEFGFRDVDGSRIPQSYCRRCRSSS